jgi:hypothetical protein
MGTYIVTKLGVAGGQVGAFKEETRYASVL